MSNINYLLVRQPSSLLAQGQITHIAAPQHSQVQYSTALAQWQSYIKAFEAQGWNVIRVEPVDQCPDSVFVEDAVIVFGSLAVLASPGHPTRQAETVALNDTLLPSLLQRKIISQVAKITKPATLDGGDVLKVQNTVYVGLSSRTNKEGIAQLTALLQPLQYTVVTVPVTKALHLKSAVTALPDGTVLGYDPIVDDPTLFPSYLSVPEAHGVAVVVLSPTHVIMSSHAPKTQALIEQRGFTVTTLDISQFEALEGCVTCLSVRIRSK